MSREDILRILKASYSDSLTIDDVTALLTGYCVEEYKKPIEDTNRFIDILLSFKILLPQYIKIALEYYERKFVINKILKGDKIIYIY